MHYHGTPISGPALLAHQFLIGRHAFVSFAAPLQLAEVAECCQSFAFDNGAFSAWRSGSPVTKWEPYYDWVCEWERHPGFDWAIIPDVIDGGEQDNDELISEWRSVVDSPISGVPVWHLHESLARLVRLASAWPRVALGSSGDFAEVDSDRWRARMAEALSEICDERGRPICKLHGLRMLNKDVFTRYPFASADSTNAGQNGDREADKMGLPTAAQGADWIAARRIEPWNSAPSWQAQPVQTALFGDY